MPILSQITPPTSWKIEFARSADLASYREAARRTREEKLVDQRRQKDKEDKRSKDDADDEIEMLAFASQVEIADFEYTLDRYDEATYEALIENEQLLKQLGIEREEMLESAFVLPDGRRVFESADGIRVFDEFGEELDADTVTADEIEDWRPKAETFQSVNDQIDRANEERAALFEYQQELADARQRLEDGEITRDELRSFERQLAEDMPESVRDNLEPSNRPELTGTSPEIVRNQVQAEQQPAPIRDAPTF